MSQEPTGKEISPALEKLTITNDLEKNGKTNEISSFFKPKILRAIDRISTPSMITYLGRKPLTSTKFLFG